MATLDLSRATALISMNDANLVKFGTAELATAESWSFNNGRTDDLQLDGSGMTFDAKGHALTGTVTRIGIDLGDNDFDNPDILITGIKANAATLDDGTGSFWRFLEGNDTIIGPRTSFTSQSNVVFGDGLSARTGIMQGGADTIYFADGRSDVTGDVRGVGSQTTGTTLSDFRGGADQLIGTATARQQSISGDVHGVNASGKLTGGNDTILIQAEEAGSYAVGDAHYVQGLSGRIATVYGGSDHISAGGRSAATLVGDVMLQYGNSVVYGGNDVLFGADAATLVTSPNELIVGDVATVYGKMVAGHDKMWGNDGDDFLYGDVVDVVDGGRVTAGHDTIYGGVGDDYVFGDGELEANTVGGNDALYGDSGEDTIWGGGGSDLLDGGTGVDNLIGGTGNDTYVVDNDAVVENAGQGTDTILTRSVNVTLVDNVENLTYTGTSNFLGTGNGLANAMRGSSGADYLQGLAGNDKLIGGAHSDSLYGGDNDDLLIGGSGADLLDGGQGFDIASYEGSEQGVKVSLNGSVTAIGDAVGDTFMLVEGLRGSSYGDVLTGNSDANRLEGGSGNDALSGLGGADVIVGGRGRDVLAGGTQGDKFVFSATADSGVTATNRDVITDFTKGQDLIDLMAMDANTATGANDVFRLLAKGTATSAVGTGMIGWYQENAAGTANDKTILRINNDADAAIDMTIEIRGLVNFTAADFIL